MTVTDHAKATAPTSTKRAKMDFARKTALVAGALYILSFVSIPTLVLYGPVLNDPTYITGPGPDTPVIFGAILEIIVALAGIGTAVALYPIVKRQNEGIALGFVGTPDLGSHHHRRRRREPDVGGDAFGRPAPVSEPSRRARRWSRATTGRSSSDRA